MKRFLSKIFFRFFAEKKLKKVLNSDRLRYCTFGELGKYREELGGFNSSSLMKRGIAICGHCGNANNCIVIPIDKDKIFLCDTCLDIGLRFYNFSFTGPIGEDYTIYGDPKEFLQKKWVNVK